MNKKTVKLLSMRSWLLLLLISVAVLSLAAGLLIGGRGIPADYRAVLAQELGKINNPDQPVASAELFSGTVAHPLTAGIAYYRKGVDKPLWQSGQPLNLSKGYRELLFSRWFQGSPVAPVEGNGARLLVLPVGSGAVLAVTLHPAENLNLLTRLRTAFSRLSALFIPDGLVLILLASVLTVSVLAALLLPVVWLRQPLSAIIDKMQGAPAKKPPRRLRTYAAELEQLRAGEPGSADTGKGPDDILEKLLPLQRGFDYQGFNASAFFIKRLDERKDYYDVFPLGDGRFAVFSGEVSGRGPVTSLLMVRLYNAVRAFCRAFDNPAEVLHEVNRFFYHETETTAFNVFLGYYNPGERELLFSQAGGLSLYHFRVADKEWQTYHQDILPAGLMDPDLYREQLGFSRLEPATGDIIGLFSDGMLKLDPDLWQKEAASVFLGEGPLGEKVLAYQQKVNGMTSGEHRDDLLGLFVEI